MSINSCFGAIYVGKFLDAFILKGQAFVNAKA